MYVLFYFILFYFMNVEFFTIAITRYCHCCSLLLLQHNGSQILKTQPLIDVLNTTHPFDRPQRVDRQGGASFQHRQITYLKGLQNIFSHSKTYLMHSRTSEMMARKMGKKKINMSQFFEAY